MSKRTEIKALLKRRGISEAAPEFAKHVSGGRVSRVTALNDQEADKLLSILREFTPACMVEGIYTICHEMGAIKSKELCEANEFDMRLFCLSEVHAIGVHVWPEGKRLMELEYMSLYILASELGEAFIARSAALN